MPISYESAVELKQLVGHFSSNGMLVADIGAHWGHSTSALLEATKDFNGTVYAIDKWDNREDYLKFAGVIEHYRDISGIEFPVTMKMSSLEAVKKFADESLDVVYLDADHRYTEFVKDLNAWYPKVKPKGLFCGHDCELPWSQWAGWQRGEIDKVAAADEDNTSFACHAGVVRGLFDFFEDRYNHKWFSHIWWVWQGDGLYVGENDELP